MAAPNPAPPLGQSYFRVDLGSLSDPEETGSGQETSTPLPTTTQTSEATPTQTDSEEENNSPEPSGNRNKSVAPDSAAFVLQLIKVVRWPIVVLILIAVLGSCLLSGCSIGLFGRQCFETNTHHQAPKSNGPRADQDISGDGLSLQTRRAISKNTVPKNIKVTFFTTPKSTEGEAEDQGSVEHVRVVMETNL